MRFPFRNATPAEGAGDPVEASPVFEAVRQDKPVVWLLGKTGAGKTSLIHALTGLSSTEIGNGFEPRTRTAEFFDFPATDPLMRFLDTRGLGEAGYDPVEDLRECEGHSHVILAVARLDDPVQGELAAALAAVRRRKPSTRIILVHTGADLLPDQDERHRAEAANTRLLQGNAGSALPSVVLSLAPSQRPDLGPLHDLLAETMPEVVALLLQEDLRDAEKAAFAKVRAQVVLYASAAGTSDVAPIVGAVSVPAIQAAMLRMLAGGYGVPWSRSLMAGFLTSLGVGIVARFGVGFGLRQLAKLIPVYGQTVGAAAAGTVSFAATFALGRAAAYYLHHTKSRDEVSTEDMREVYRRAFKDVFRGPV